jgi:hypothetical protein
MYKVQSHPEHILYGGLHEPEFYWGLQQLQGGA